MIEYSAIRVGIEHGETVTSVTYLPLRTLDRQEADAYVEWVNGELTTRVAKGQRLAG